MTASLSQVRQLPTMSDMPSDEQLQTETLDLINTEVTTNLAQQDDVSARFESKALALVGYAGALSAFLATRHAQPVLATVAYVAYGLAAGFGIVVFMVGPGLKSFSAPRRLFNNYAQRSKTATLAALSATRVQLYEANIPELRKKYIYLITSLMFLVIGVPFMVASLLTVTHHA